MTDTIAAAEALYDAAMAQLDEGQEEKGLALLKMAMDNAIETQGELGLLTAKFYYQFGNQLLTKVENT